MEDRQWFTGKTADVKRYKFPLWFGGKEAAYSAGVAEELGLIPGQGTRISVTQVSHAATKSLHATNKDPACPN